VGGTLSVLVREPSGVLVRANLPLVEGDVR
jgi:hypothetical protein